ncbi:CvpA family protein [Campylobacter sp. faydin G-24]|uniref:CvpA family protein n=1 Tax=Campylobacter anatolicus TaxID=2829105 RepID=A0ABS5HFS5_9BACT|nr:CvpA family protein [Campylobacter anatolicus]MBR8462427.1 CvpA family protein [Campylobacter anatolicus]MBR8463124.1 CvpA family protein [Campylobacter anatolicus]MBR8465555.1 CvpA family protein [Campylobacter anatolicus]
MDAFNWFDIVVVALVLILGIKGLFNGLIKEAFGLIGLIGGLIVASRFSAQAETLINENIYKFDNASMLQFVGFVALWIVFWILCLLIGKFLSKMIALSGLGFLDRFGGFIAGSGKIFLIFAAVIAVISGTGLSKNFDPLFQNSKVHPTLLEAGKWITNIDVNQLKNDVNNIVTRTPDTNKTDALIKMDTNTSINLDKNTTNGDEQ